jgi:hypothetical protein
MSRSAVSGEHLAMAAQAVEQAVEQFHLPFV